MKDFFKKIFQFQFSKKRVLLAILLVIAFIIIGLIAHFIMGYLQSDEVILERYAHLLSEHIDLQEKQVIAFKEYDFNQDGLVEIIFLLGKPIYRSTLEGKQEDSTVESYRDLEVIYFDEKENIIETYATNKTFSADVFLEIYEDQKEEYIYVTDSSSGNITILQLIEGKFKDLISSSFAGEFKGYTFFLEEDGTKLSITLDHIGKSYLPENNETYELDFSSITDTLRKYRESYNKDRYSNFSLQDINQDGVYELVANQIILYRYIADKTLPDHLGMISVIFRLENGKFVYDHITVNP